MQQSSESGESATGQTSSVSSSPGRDWFAGFMVFLIAMPLCLAIARASGFPPIAGIWTAVIGGIVCSAISNSQLTIKGPAAGLIVIVLGAVQELGAEFGSGLGDADKAMLGYKLALGVGVAAGAVQLLLGLFRGGKLADFFPLTPIHGMLASIGIIIISKQMYELIGVTPEKGAGPLSLLASLPSAFQSFNPEIACIGGISLLLLFGIPALPFRWVRLIPVQLVVIAVAIFLGVAFDLEHRHTYLFPDHLFGSSGAHEYEVGPKFLVSMPEVLKDPLSAFAFPDFRGLLTLTGIKFLFLFSAIGSLESLLSAKAIELLDPQRRQTDFNRDLAAVGMANMVSSFVGGLPMISEIVRSKANIDAGARSKMSNFAHGIFLLTFVLLFPNLIHRIPLAALGAMLIYTGFRLASPKEFVHTYKVGVEQLIVFIGTILATLATDLLIGIAVGIFLEIGFHLWHGTPLRGLMRSQVDIESAENSGRIVLHVQRACVFTNWLSLRTLIIRESHAFDEVVINFESAAFVDHSVQMKLQDLIRYLADQNKTLIIAGLERHVPLSDHPFAARKSVGNSAANLTEAVH